MTESGFRVAAVLGNTTCRFALMEGLEVRGSIVLAHAELGDSGTVERLRWMCAAASAASTAATGSAEERIVEAGVCSVVPSLERALDDLLRDIGIARRRAVRPAAAAFFPSRYRSMDALGADRYCGALAARQRYGAPVIVADCGTATTLNVVDRDGVFLGGAIAPGVETALRALHERTAQLPLPSAQLPLPSTHLSVPSAQFPAASAADSAEAGVGVPPLIGADTAGSMRAGAVHFTRYALEGMVRAIKKQTGDDTPLIVTGGNAPLLLGAGLLCAPQEHDAHLLFRGVIYHLLLTS
jgi:type III pantothenate kinase